LLLGVVGVAALALVVMGVLALRGALSSKQPSHTSTPAPSATTSSPAASVQRTSSAPAPVLLIRVIREPCKVFVKNAASNNILQSDNNAVPLGTKLVFVQVPLQIQISDPHCADVYVHGRRQLPAATAPWILSVQS
jgi:hypothetical protein